jgi:hypothetical protein
LPHPAQVFWKYLHAAPITVQQGASLAETSIRVNNHQIPILLDFLKHDYVRVYVQLLILLVRFAHHPFLRVQNRGTPYIHERTHTKIVRLRLITMSDGQAHRGTQSREGFWRNSTGIETSQPYTPGKDLF